MKNINRINISLPITTCNRINELKFFDDIKINVSSICNKALLKSLDYIDNEITEINTHLKESERLKRLIQLHKEELMEYGIKII